MYIPESFNEERKEVLHELIRNNPFGMIISNGDRGPVATSVPILLSQNESKFGLLQCHIARANPHWKNIDGQDVLVIFQGENAYISPNWYPTKEENGMVVPTWNYAMVQARGVARVVDDAGWLKEQITALTNQAERGFSRPWKVSDAPADYIDGQIKGIIGIEIKVDSLEGKWKVSQNRSVKDRHGVANHFDSVGNTEMAALVREYGGLKGEI
ncbi:MAG: FMN-binding negative transcriptional regulator [Candidatus Melainabacteria bacterium]|jgi:transcriptional regulator|nr:FMN-binding negative transcriptional regulator [Candidatus Melainabacteria bacterium]